MIYSNIDKNDYIPYKASMNILEDRYTFHLSKDQISSLLWTCSSLRVNLIRQAKHISISKYTYYIPITVGDDYARTY